MKTAGLFSYPAFVRKIGAAIDTHLDILTWAAGFTTDGLLLYQGKIENGFILYAAAAALMGNLVMLGPSLIETLKNREQGKIWKERARWIAAPIHHTSGPALFCSGLNLGHTGLSTAEMAFGVCSLSGSVMQYWGRTFLRMTGLNRHKWIEAQGSGKLATYCYTPIVLAAFADAWRLHSLALVGVGIFSGAVIVLLFMRRDSLPSTPEIARPVLDGQPAPV